MKNNSKLIISPQEALILKTYDNMIKIAQMKKEWMEMVRKFYGPFWLFGKGK